jgi:RNA polymerase sigma factor (sigma-70 family)
LAEPDADLEQHAMLFQLVGRLPAAQRRVIELRYIEGRSLMEAGKELGKTEGAIKQLQRRAIDNLRAQMEASHA